MILGTIICQTAYWSMWAVHNSAVRSVGLGRLTDNLYRVCIPLNQLATATFMVRRGTWCSALVAEVGLHAARAVKKH